jgi:hypothetical protein
LQDDNASPQNPQGEVPAPPLRVGLSGKLLFLTILFVMVAEVLIYVPSVANFRLNWLNDRLAAAYTAALGPRSEGSVRRMCPSYYFLLRVRTPDAFVVTFLARVHAAALLFDRSALSAFLALPRRILHSASRSKILLCHNSPPLKG